MNRSLRIFAILGVMVLLGSQPVLAQTRAVNGTVTDARTGQPLPGVNVLIVGTASGAVTGLDGTYAVNVSGADALLQFSFIGYVSQQIPVGTQSTIDVALAEDIAVLDDIVVVGYGTQRRGDVTSSIAVVEIDEANTGIVTSPDQMLEGRVAGVQVIQNNGEPGAGISVRVRGGTSIAASNEPLYVIDGVPVDGGNVIPDGVDAGGGSAPPGRNPLTLINPSDIEQISVLKDAAATAIYGSRGANGVVLITTRTGVQGRVTVDYEGRVASASASNTIGLLSGDEYRTFIEEQVAARTLGYDESGALVDNNANGRADVLDALGTSSSNFEDAILRTGVSQQHNLAFSGGTQNTQYRASMSYLDQEGIIRSSGIERLTARLNGNSQALGGRLRLGLNLTSALSKDDFVTYENVAGFEGGLFTNVYDFNPTLPIYDDASPDGFYEIPGQVSIRNPVAIADQIVDEAETTRTLGNISAELDLFAGLTGRVNIGGDRAVSRRNAFFPRANPIGALTTGRAVQRDLERTSITFQSYLTYRNTEQESDHSYDVLGGYEFNEFTFEGFGTEARNFITDVTGSDAIEAGTVFQSGTFSDKEQSRLISFFGRANYNFQEKYYLSGSLRYDGSSRFGADNKWALFPAISGAWRISQESFLADNTTISDLRLRAGYGVVGNQAIPNYLSLALLRADAGNRAVLGGSVFTGYAPFQLPNAGLRWEEKEEFTIGLDYGLFDGTVYGALEFYRNTTDNLLLDVPLPQPSPVSSRIENVGSLRNTGIDFTVEGLLINQEDLSLTLGGVFNTNSNEIVDLGGRQQIFTGSVSGRGQSGQNALLLTPGQPFPVFYTFEFVEVNGNGDQLFNDYEDTDGDGFGDRLVGTTTAPTDDDRRIVGDPRPDFSYGFRGKVDYKQWGLSLFFRGEQGRELFNNSALVFQTKSAAAQGRNFFADALDDPDALREAAVFSSRWIQDASFLKLDNITLEYRIDGAKISPHVRNARLFASVDNAFTVTPYSGYDPEVNTNAQVGLIPATGIDYTNYPLPRTFTLGVQLGF